jgi:hypothetical protein
MSGFNKGGSPVLGRNFRKGVILAVLREHGKGGLTPYEIALRTWAVLTPEEQAATTFPDEWERTRHALTRLRKTRRWSFENERWFGVTAYVRAYHVKGNGRELSYRITKKGQSVLRGIVSGRLPGWTDLLGRIVGERFVKDE